MKKGEKVICIEALKTWPFRPAIKQGWVYVVESLALVDESRHLTADRSKAAMLGITLAGIKPLDPQISHLPARCFVSLEGIKLLKSLRRGKRRGG